MYALDYRAAGFAGFGATLVPIPPGARGPTRLSEIATALRLPAATNPTIKGQLLIAQSNVAAMTDAGVTLGEQQYMKAHALAAGMGMPIPALQTLTMPAGTSTTATKDAANAITAITGALTKALAPVTVTPPAGVDFGPPMLTPPAPTSLTRFVPHQVRGAWAALERPVGPLPAWQWLALGGAGLVAVGLAARLAKFAVLGGTVAAGAYGLVTYQRWRSGQRAQGAPA